MGSFWAYFGVIWGHFWSILERFEPFFFLADFECFGPFWPISEGFELVGPISAYFSAFFEGFRVFRAYFRIWACFQLDFGLFRSNLSHSGPDS